MDSLLLVNPRSGGGAWSLEELVREARARGVEPHVLRAGEEAAEVARRSGARVLGMAGGDGSLAAVAAVAVETGAAFVCVPLGTRNHLAGDLGLDRRDPLAALAAFDDDATERRIDVGRVDGRLFLNNVSLGDYAGLVHRRERHRRRGAALARVRALLETARHPHPFHARVNGEPVTARIVLVGNNRYELDVFTLGARHRLDAGELQLRTTSGVERVAARFEIELPAARVRAAIDGEPAQLDTPLVLESLPGALRVLLPGTRRQPAQ